VKARFPLPAQLAVAVVLGCLAGALLGPSAAPLGEVGLLVVKLLKMLATPLVFFAILDAVVATRIEPRRGLQLLGISLGNAIVAGAIAISIAHLLPLGRDVDLDAWRAAVGPTVAAPAVALDRAKALERLVPESLVQPFLENNVVFVVLLALLTGGALRQLERSKPEEALAGRRLASAGLHVTATILGWVVRAVPLVAFCVLAKVTGTSGFRVFSALGVFVFIVALGLALHAVVYYSLLLLAAGIAPWRFFPLAAEALLTAFGTGSSLATLPVTLRTLDEKMHVSRESSRLAACVGTNLNHDGILLYEAAAALFVAQIHGLSLGPAAEIGVVATAALAAFGIAGIPDAGLITLALVLGSVHPSLVAAVPLLLPVDWLLGRLRATVNVTSDLVVANLLDRLARPAGARE
jgi:Na+/H+-dicarboxylate symporter